jgi:hypothetical protein
VRCTPADGSPAHTFTLPVATSLTTSSTSSASTHYLFNDGRPHCPDHPANKVWRDGYYGAKTHKRQRYKCVSPVGDVVVHTFTEALPRQRPPTGDCLECDRVYRAHEGPQSARNYSFVAREIAAALVRVGEGATYTEAAQFVRRRAKRLKQSSGGGLYPSQYANLTCDWVEVFAPVLSGALFAPFASPETVVIDNLPFHVGRLRDGMPVQSGRLLFHVFGAIAYDENRVKQVWHVQSAPTNTRAEWEAFLRSAPGVPKRVICDEATGLLPALAIVWPETEVFICQWHLYDQGLRALKEAKLHSRDGVLYHLLTDALKTGGHNPYAWNDFVHHARQHKSATKLQTWLDQKEPLISSQLARAYWPVSNGAVERELRRIKVSLFDRRFAFGNRHRTDRLLALMALHANGLANEADYAHTIRDYLTGRGGHSPSRHLILDPRGTRSIRR